MRRYGMNAIEIRRMSGRYGTVSESRSLGLGCPVQCARPEDSVKRYRIRVPGRYGEELSPSEGEGRRAAVCVPMCGWEV